MKIDLAIKASVDWARQNKRLCWPYIKDYAQELDDSVINEHIGLYVNAFSESLGEEGLAAIEFFLHKGRQAGMFPDSYQQPLTIV